MEANRAAQRGRIGIDLGLHHFIACSDGRFIDDARAGIARERLRLARKRVKTAYPEPSASALREMEELRAKAIEEQRAGIERITDRLVEENELIAIEDLDENRLMALGRIRQQIAEAQFDLFATTLKAKAAEADCTVVTVHREFPSSMRCSACGQLYRSLGSRRRWICPECRTHHDRDVNAARNILEEGERLLAATHRGRRR